MPNPARHRLAWRLPVVDLRVVVRSGVRPRIDAVRQRAPLL
jgi:hypothetical protein